MIHTFDDIEIDTATREIRRAGEGVHVEPQVFDVLVYLADHRERVVTKIELLDEVWGDRFVSESALTSRIKSARQICGDDGRTQKVIRTVHGHGYRFVAELGRHNRASAAASADGDTMGDGLVTTTRAAPGRRNELARLEHELGAAAAGRRRTVFVTGEAGIGKSVLVEAFLESVDESVRILRGQCLHQRGAVEPYFCLLDALARTARTEGAASIELLERVAPSWLSQMPSLYDDETAARLERKVLGASPHRMLREGVDAFEAFASSSAVVLVLEDLHWADGNTLDAVEMLAMRIDPTHLLLVGTMRMEPGPAADLVARLAASGSAEEVRLTGLEESAVAELAHQWSNGLDVDPAVVAALHRRSGGVPLFAREILAGWTRGGALDISGDTLVAASGFDSDSGAIPENVRHLVDRELAVLAADELAALEGAAVAGLAFDGATVAAGLGTDIEEVERTLLAMARRLHYLEALGGSSWPDGTVSARYEFTHELYRQATYDRLTPTRRVALHRLVGEAIEAGYQGHDEERVAELAHHFVIAGDAPRSVEYLRRAGEQAAARSGHSQALDLLLSALDWIPNLTAGPDRNRAELKIRMTLGPVLVATRGWFGEAVTENYERALELCDQQGPSCPEWAIARYGLATVTELRGEYETTDQLLQPLVADDETDTLRLEANELLACSTFHQGDFERSLRHARRVIDRYDPDDFSVAMARLAEHPLSSCNSWASLAAWFLGRSDESLELAGAAIAAGEERLYALSTARVQLAFLHQLRDEPAECRQWAGATIELAERQGFPFRMIQADALGGWAEARLGRTKEGMARLADAMARYEASTARLTQPYFIGLEADAHLLAGQPDVALSRCEDALAAMAATTRTFFFEPDLHRLRAHALAALDRDAGEVHTALDEAALVVERLDSPPLRLRIAVARLRFDLERGERPTPIDELEGLVAFYDGQAEIPDVTVARRLIKEVTNR